MDDDDDDTCEVKRRPVISDSSSDGETQRPGSPTESHRGQGVPATPRKRPRPRGFEPSSESDSNGPTEQGPSVPRRSTRKIPSKHSRRLFEEGSNKSDSDDSDNNEIGDGDYSDEDAGEDLHDGDGGTKDESEEHSEHGVGENESTDNDDDEYEEEGIDDSETSRNKANWRTMLAEVVRDFHGATRAVSKREYLRSARKPQLQRKKRTKKEKEDKPRLRLRRKLARAVAGDGGGGGGGGGGYIYADDDDLEDLMVYVPLIRNLRQHASRGGLSNLELVKEFENYEIGVSEDCDGTCLCGWEGLRTLYHMRNKNIEDVFERTLSSFIVGSECINWFSWAITLFQGFAQGGFTSYYDGIGRGLPAETDGGPDEDTDQEFHIFKITEKSSWRTKTMNELPKLMEAYDQVPVRVHGEDVFVYVNRDEEDVEELIPGTKYRVRLRLKIGRPSNEGHGVPRFTLLKAEAVQEEFNPRHFINY